MLEIDNKHLGKKRDVSTNKDEMYMLVALACASNSVDL